MKIKIIDAIMGKGKSSWSIQTMQNDMNNNYVYITPFLDEVERVKHSCKAKKFKEPINFGNGKQDNLHELLLNGDNICSTHALFRASTDVTKNLISSHDYILILDEVMDVVEKVNLKKDDIPSMLELELISIDDDGFVNWNEDKSDYDGKYNDIKIMARNKSLVVVNNVLLMWNFPVEVFNSFKEVYVLTYLFNSQVQRYYYDMHGVDYEYYGLEKINDEYVLLESGKFRYPDKEDDIYKIKSLIEILDHEKLNSIGNSKTALSSTWYSKSENSVLINMLKKNLTNYFKNIRFAKSKEILWTTFKPAKSKLSGAGYTKGFLSCNARATNEYGDRHELAYCVNIFLNPIISNFFIDRGIIIEEEEYATSEMLQWIWRSAIRNNEKIFIYIPSSRMRQLLESFLN